MDCAVQAKSHEGAGNGEVVDAIVESSVMRRAKREAGNRRESSLRQSRPDFETRRDETQESEHNQAGHAATSTPELVRKSASPVPSFIPVWIAPVAAPDGLPMPRSSSLPS